MKVIRKFLDIVILVVILQSYMITIAYALNNQIEKTKVEIEYQYKEVTNTVIATMVSNNELKPTKVSWKLSEDRKHYTFEFSANTTYDTTVEDIYGNIIPVTINVTQVQEKKAKIEMDYQYQEKTNTVMVTIISDIELKPTKVSWKLSQDKKHYTFEFSANTTYETTVEDIYGNIIPVTINVTQVQEKKAKIKLDYKYKEETNTVVVTIISDIELKPTKVSWKLNEDKKQYMFEFSENTTYDTTVEDIYGNVIQVKINVTQIIKPEVKVEYKYNTDTNKVLATIISNIALQPTKISWELSEDRKQYTFEFSGNTTYDTTVVDRYGDIIPITINVTQIDDKAPKITTEYIYNEDDSITVILHSNEKLGATKVNWKLSDDQLSYTTTFYTNQEYATSLQDIYGNETWVKIKIQLKKHEYTYPKGPNVTVKYLYDSNEKVTVKIVSDKELKPTKPTWQLSDDRKTYTKVFTSNNIYTTPIVDVDGIQVEVTIIVNYYKDTHKGVDVSEHQKIIDWQAVKNSGNDFAIIRVGYRGWASDGTLVEDRFFSTNVIQATKVGMDIGFYFFSQAVTIQEAREEAQYTLNLLSKYNVPIKYPIAIDTERTPVGTGRADKISKELRTNIMIAFCEVIRSAGYQPMVYANKNWLLNDLEVERLNCYDIWMAHFAKVTDYKYPYTIWQYTSTGTVNGIVGNADINIAYKKY